ncbi:MAG: ATPase [Clostridia bacterium]|jgi:vacuolar-type H+-ATPase subunit H|nr:ATPase [Clostridia bacterium]
MEILELLEKLEGSLEKGNAVLFTDKVLVNKEELYETLTDIRLKLPTEIKQAKWVVEERNKILLDAKKEADTIIADAERELARLVADNEITKKAMDEAERIIEDANQTAREMRLGSIEYADNVLYEMEKSVKSAMEQVHHQFVNMEDHLTETAATIHTNREELRGKKN